MMRSVCLLLCFISAVSGSGQAVDKAAKCPDGDCDRLVIHWDWHATCDQSLGLEPRRFLAHFRKLHLDLSDVIRLGKEAAREFRDQYGEQVDFTLMEDDAYVNAAVTMGNSHFLFQPFITPQDCNQRTVMVSRNGESQYFDSPTEEAGWLVLFLGGHNSTGVFRGYIPPFSGGLRGFRSFDPPAQCTRALFGRYNQHCRNILNPKKPLEPAWIKEGLKYYSSRFQQPGNHFTVDAFAYSDTWGLGEHTGYGTEGPGGKVSYNGIISFPPS